MDPFPLITLSGKLSQYSPPPPMAMLNRLSQWLPHAMAILERYSMQFAFPLKRFLHEGLVPTELPARLKASLKAPGHEHQGRQGGHSL